MTLDEAIKVLRQHNVKGESVLKITRGQALEKDLLSQVLDSCEQLMSEKAEYKRILKSAANVLKRFKPCDGDYDCSECIHQRRNCDYGDRFKWRYADEALALIGEDIDVPAAEDDTNVGHKRRNENN